MPAEQRIIGGGLLTIGVAVVLILIYLFSQGGMSPREAYDKLMDEAFPAWLEAEEDGNYIKQKRAAEEVLAVLDEGSRTAVLKLLRAAPGNKKAQRVLALLDQKAFEKNRDGLYQFDDGWYRDTTHAALLRLSRAVDGVKSLGEIRDIATETLKAVEMARTGSGLPVPLPAAKPVPKDDVSIVDPNPVYVHDVELYRVFGVTAEGILQALATPDPGAGKALSARLRWAREVAPSNLAARVASIPERAEALRRLSTDVLRSTRELANDKDAAPKLASLLKTAAALVGTGISGDPKTVFDENREKFENGAAIAAVLTRESEMLNAYRATVRDFGATFSKSFGG